MYLWVLFAAQSSVDSLCFWLGVRNEMKRKTTSTYWYSPMREEKYWPPPPRIWAVYMKVREVN